ncbi:TSUP family transporter [Cohnella sp. CFH 77786]|uniref:sulfite exporter TauE/SafE family protein n=1 Tax=Cohnella sp. CFH 77786 TaxID=2662265 RepID=UPI001C60A304|nr:TSUP family transporter [Cohnella sp. CFH 77786]MBW5445457.1 TSUP family transporter [Cohnella sp. CFH 77786]
MESLDWTWLLVLMAGGFLAAFVDSVVGGGGLVALPLLLASGMTPTMALGTNKLAGTLSSLTSTASFVRSRKVNGKLVLSLFPLSLAGAAFGTYAVQHIPSGFLRPVVVGMLVMVTLYTIFKKSWGQSSTYRGLSVRSAAWMGVAAAALGFYDGFFGPGTGSFLIFVFLALGFDFVMAAGNAKVLNFASNIASLAVFASFGYVDYRYGLPMGAAMITGSLIGSRVAIRKGSSYVRPLFIGISGLLIGKQAWELLH